jgi:hypothetical protein
MVFVPQGQYDSSQAGSGWNHLENSLVPAGRLNLLPLRHPQKASRDGLPTVSKASRLISLSLWFRGGELRGEHPPRDLCATLSPMRVFLARKPNSPPKSVPPPSLNPPSVTSVTSVRRSPQCASFSPRNQTVHQRAFRHPASIPPL